MPPVVPVAPVTPIAPAPIAPAPGAATPTGAPVPPESLRPPFILRFALWLIALPLGSYLVFRIASSLKLLTKSQLEDTFLRSDWGRFVPVARVLPLCALAIALIIQLGEFGLVQLRARNLRKGPPGRSRPRTGPTRPLAPTGTRQPDGNGARSRDRVTS
jgi:hypothetical protein